MEYADHSSRKRKETFVEMRATKAHNQFSERHQKNIIRDIDKSVKKWFRTKSHICDSHLQGIKS